MKQGPLRDAGVVVLFYTDPSGDPAPSAQDLAFTRRLSEAGEAVGIRLVDHLTLGSRPQETSVLTSPLFLLGRVAGTPGALDALEAANKLPYRHLVRHVRGDSGEAPDEDRKEKELSLREGCWILSTYRSSGRSGSTERPIERLESLSTTNCQDRSSVGL